jgi:kumamolisin
MAKAATKTRSHTVVLGTERTHLPGAVATARANAKAVIEVSLKLRRKKPLPITTRRPAKAMERKTFAAAYGASAADIAKVVKTFRGFGLAQIGEANPATRTVRLRGAVASMEKAFQVTLFDYKHVGGDYRGRVGSIYVPTGVKSIVRGVFGLDNRRAARRGRPSSPASAPAGSGAVPSSWYVPSELAKHYGFPAGDGNGQAIGLLELGGGYFPSDLKQFCALANIPGSPKVTPVGVDGASTSANDDAAGEVMLDTEIAAGLCPKANIVIYFAPNTDRGLIDVISDAVHDQKNDPGVLSMSWGGPESSYTKQALNEIGEVLKDAAALGVTVCFASGDDGSSDGVKDGHAHVNFPASSPFALAVGGTTIPVKGSTQPDIVWREGTGLNDGGPNDGSTGAGVSAIFPRPAWQSKITAVSVNPGAMAGRCLPDISANADWTKSPYLLCVDGATQPNGGTSAATPLVASLLTLINAQRPAGKRVGYVTPVLYQPASQGGGTIGSDGCTDVVSGNNNTAAVGGYSAGRGYDAASGWGTPLGAKLAQLL